MKHQIINENWQTWRDHNAFALVFAVPEDAKQVNLPHDAVFETPQLENSVNGGKTGNLDGGVFQYYKVLEDCDPSLQYALRIHGCGGIAKVSVNESIVGELLYPYLSKTFEITEYLNFDGHDELLITVNAQDNSSRYYVGGGLTRDVELLAYGDIAIQETRMTTLSLNGNTAETEIIVKVQNSGDTDICVPVTVSVESAGSVSGEVFVPAHGCEHAVLKACFAEIHPWSAEDPYLYHVTVQAGEDCEDLQFGFRTMSVTAEEGLKINGKHVLLRGACIHHDQGILGGTAYEDYELYRMMKLKEAGFNAIRTAHNPASEAQLKACDVVGMYVMNEAFDAWSKSKNHSDSSLFFEQIKQDVIANMCEVSYNHPSVILYSSGNEISDIHTKKGIRTSAELTGYFHRFDPTRPVTNGINGAFATGSELIKVASDLTGQPAEFYADGDINRFMALIATRMDEIVCHEAIGNVLEKLEPTMDILGYNYMVARYSKDHAAYPKRIVVGTEDYPKDIGKNVLEMEKNPNVIGDFTWTGFDYIGETGPYPHLFNMGGDVSMIGQRRPVSYYREIAYGLTDTPHISVRPPQSFHAPYMFGPWKLTDSLMHYAYEEGTPLQVEVYSRGNQIRLYQNGELLETKDNHEVKPFFTTFDVAFKEGELKAEAVKDGAVIGTRILKSAKEVSCLHTSVYRFDTLSFIEVTLLDENGTIVHNAKETLSAEGNILAMSSAFTPYDCGFTKQEIQVQEGAVLIIAKHGTLTLNYGSLKEQLEI